MDWISLLSPAQQKRKAIALSSNALRLCNGEADGAEGGVIDVFAKHVQLQFYTTTHLAQEAQIVDALQNLLQPQFLVVKERLDSNGLALAKPQMRLLIGNAEQSCTEVFEGKARFGVDLLDTVNPGLFLDMRAQRLALADLGTSGKMLNLFCYTGSFSVHARLAGTEHVVNVDLSAKILDKVRQNYALNQIAIQKGEFFRGDALDYLQYAVRKGLRFETIVLDPPSFSRTQKGIFQVALQLQNMIADCALLLQKAGHLLVSTNYSEVDENVLREWIALAFQKQKIAYEVIWMRGQDADFVGSGTRRDSWLVAALVKRKAL